MVHGHGHAMDLAILPLEDRDLKPRCVLVGACDFDVGWRRHAILEAHSLAQACDSPIADSPAKFGGIDFRNVGSWMKQRSCQRAVVGQNERAVGVKVEPSNRVYAFLHVAQQFLHGRATFGIGHRGHDPGRFIEKKVDVFLGAKRFAVDRDYVARGIGFTTKLANNLAVD